MQTFTLEKTKILVEKMTAPIVQIKLYSRLNYNDFSPFKFEILCLYNFKILKNLNLLPSQ